jgi:hypothetical protein
MNPFDMLALQGVGAAYSALPTAFAIYVLLLVDARRKDSPAAADTQLGIKTVAATIAIVATAMFAFGLQGFLHVLLTFEDFMPRIKAALPNLLFGGLGVVASAFVLFPRTNAQEFPKAKRLAAGIIALVAGGAMLPLLAMFLDRLLAWPSWSEVARALTVAVVAVIVFAAAFSVLGRLSGIDMASQGPTMGQGVGVTPPAISPGQPQPQYPQQEQPQYPQQQQPQYPQQEQPQYPQQQQPQGQYPPQQGGGGVGPGWTTPGGG